MSTPKTNAMSSSRPADAPPFRYDAVLADQIEQKWQAWWEREGTFRVGNPGDAGFDVSKPKFYCLDMFPYPSGAGLHVGHPEGYTATDIVCRFMRMKGHNVLHPMGWDAFGLPAEQYAIQTGVHPAITTKNAINEFRRQLKRFGFSYDWSREVATIDPEYYRWTQWVFLKLYNAWFDPQGESPAYPDGQRRRGCARPIADLIAQLENGDIRVGFDGELVHIGVATSGVGLIGGEPEGSRRWHELSEQERREVIDSQRLAYLDEMTVNWCPALGTVLANDEVIDGKSERGGHPVLRKPMKQWQFRITAYAQRLLDDLALLEWPESTRTMQTEWIGRSEGAEVEFRREGIGHQASGTGEDRVLVFTTRPDTLFGATYLVVAPEHPLVDEVLASPGARTDVERVGEYVRAARNRSDVERMESKEKTGVDLGIDAINPATGRAVPVWVAEYVLMGYGTGAIMAVPAHDERDFEFAEKFGLPIVDVVHSRVSMCVVYYGERATDQEIYTDRWREVVADMIGLAISSHAFPNDLERTLHLVRTRRTADVGASSGDRAKRGAIQREWIESLEDLKLTNGEVLRSVAQDRGLHRHIGEAMTQEGFAVNSTGPGLSIDGLTTSEAKQRVIAWLEETGSGRRRVNFKLRDWVFSRQRYWGEPFPIVYDERGRHYPVSEAALPVVLPELADYAPVESDDPQPLLAKAGSWVNTTAGQAGVSADVLAPETVVRRETNTMPGSAGSSWYFLRYCDPKNDRAMIGREVDAYWMGGVGESRAVAGVDLYIGGSEHAVGHLLYSRFWQKVLFDLGEVRTPEPFRRLFHQGMITSYAYQRADKTLVPVDQVEELSEGVFTEKGVGAGGAKLSPIVAKMSKSLKNVVNPDEIIAEFGADTFRLYEMYMGPLEASKPWNTKDTVGCYRFLQRAWRVGVDEQTGELKLAAAANPQVEKLLHKTIAKVEGDIPKLAFNTSIAAMIELVNLATSLGGMTREQLERFALILSPFAPHMGEELWHKLGHTTSVAHEAFPKADPAMLSEATVEIPVQINGKVRGKIVVQAGLDKAGLEAAAMGDAGVMQLIEGKVISKTIVVPGKMVNLVVS